MTRVNNKLKLLMILGIALLFILVFGTSKVEATTYTDKDKKVSITMEDLGLGGTTTVENKWSNENDLLQIYNSLTIKNVRQNILNTYSNSPKQVSVTIKMEIPSDIVKAELKGIECQIENSNGKRYIKFNDILKYTNTPHSEPVKEDVEYIVIGERNLDDESNTTLKIKLYSSDTKYTEYIVDNVIIIRSENVPFEYHSSVVNKYGKPYSTGGLGGYFFWDKKYLQDEWSTSDEYQSGAFVPEKANLKETYYELYIDVYQGEALNIENLGTLTYAGVRTSDISQYPFYGKEFYVYKNSLDNLAKMDSNNYKKPILTAKTQSGYTLKRSVRGYSLVDFVTEEEVTGTINTENKDTKIKMNIIGIGNAKFKSIELQKNDTLYVKLEKGLQEAVKDKYTYIDLGTFDISVVEGAYNGKLKLTFDVGTKYNGKECIVGHLANGLNYESFKAKVVDGKVTIEVDSLSPFMIAMVEEKQSSTQKPSTNKPTETPKQDETNPTTDKPHIKDETPKTGTENDIVATITSILSLVSIAGIALIKKF